MNKRELDYYISNGKFAMNYLQDLSKTATGREECNKVFNHASAVACLIRVSEYFFALNETLKAQNEELIKNVRDLQSGEFNELLEKEKAKLQEEFYQMKASLIDLIEHYPDIDY